MPVAEFPGARGWGYDGVFWFAPYHRYGRPEDLRGFVDDAHRFGLGVILDVVYNHMGDVGNVLPRFSRDYAGTAGSEWGVGLSFDEDNGRPARELVTENVAYWIDEFHLDGYRFDATQCISDRSEPHILAEAVDVARDAGGRKTIYLVAENETQDSRLARPRTAGGAGLDALWNDDLHHVTTVALTGHRDAYFMDYTGAARELAASVRHGFLFQGQRYDWQNRPRGHTTRGLPPRSFVTFLENHDQIANEGLGERLWSRVARRPPARAHGPLVARARDAPALPGPGVERVGPLHVLRRLRARSAPPRSRRGVRAPCGSSRATAPPTSETASRIPRRPRPSPRAGSTGPSATRRRTRAPMRSTAISSSSGAAIRRSSARERTASPSTPSRSARPSSSCATAAPRRTAPAIACCS